MGSGVEGRALVYCAGGGIGDSLVASVVAQALHTRFAHVDALTLPHHRTTLERVPEYTEVLTDDSGDERALASAIAARAYDVCVVTWATSRTARVAQMAKIPVRVGQARRLYSWRFTHRVTVRSELGDVTSPWSDILLDYARALDCDAPGAYPHFAPTPDDEREADALRAEIGGHVPFVILHATNAIATKRGIWPTTAWSALAAALAEHFDVGVLLSGSAVDIPICEAIARDAASLPGVADTDRLAEGRVLSIAGRLGIGAFGALARQARAFVGITTGTMHVAAAVGCPTVGIFPFQSDFPDRWAPQGPRTAVVRPSFECHRGDTKENCADYACIAALRIPEILTATTALIASPR